MVFMLSMTPCLLYCLLYRPVYQSVYQSVYLAVLTPVFVQSVLPCCSLFPTITPVDIPSNTHLPLFSYNPADAPSNTVVPAHPSLKDFLGIIQTSRLRYPSPNVFPLDYNQTPV